MRQLMLWNAAKLRSFKMLVQKLIKTEKQNIFVIVIIIAII